MRILFVLPELTRLTGSERVVQTLSNTLQNREHQVTVIALKKLNTNLISKFNCDVIELKKPFLFKSILNDKGSLIRLLNRWIQKQPAFDLILSNIYAKTAINQNKSNVHYILHTDFRGECEMSDNPMEYKTAKGKTLQKYFNGRNVIGVSKGTTTHLVDFFKVCPKHAQTIYNPIDISQIQTLSNAQNTHTPKHPYLLFAGRNDHMKGIDIILNAFAKIQTQTTASLCLLTDKHETLTPKLERLGLANKVTLLPFQQNPYPFMKHAKLCVMASYYEALPTTLIESLACNTLVVSTDCHSGPREILTDKLSKWLVPVGDSEALAQKMLEALNTNITIPPTTLAPFDPNNVAAQYEALADEC